MTGHSGIVTGDSGHKPKIGHLRAEWAVTFGRNGRSRSNGISGQIGPEYAHELIVGCDAFTFVVSPASLASVICGEELSYASIILLCHKVSHLKRATRTAFELLRDGPSQQVTQCGDGVWNVTLHSSGCRAACSLRVGETLLVEQSFFYCHRL